MSSRPKSLCRRSYSSAFAPRMAPSREISVQMTVRTPRASMRRRKSSAVRPESSRQPLMATLPSRRSAPTAIFSPYFCTAPASRRSSLTAAVPRMTRPTPAAKARSMASMSRSPPPHSTKRPVSAVMRSIMPRLGVPPSRAPSRSTVCICAAPLALKSLATATGSSLYTVISS